jgi:fructose/tagatose bisphosphate aldolase
LTSFSSELVHHFTKGGYENKNGFDPRNYLPKALNKTREVVIEKIKFLGSYNKAK